MSKKRVNVVTMGCSKNLVDSEVLLSQLEKGKFVYYLESEISKRYEMGVLDAMDEIGVMCENYC